MSEDADYDIIPHEEILRLRREVEALKSNSIGGSSTGKELLDSIKELNTNMSNLFNLFKEAAEEMKLEESEAKLVAEKMSPMINKFDTLIDQNEKIAKGIVAVADMVKGEARRSRPLPMKMTATPKVPKFEKEPAFNVPNPEKHEAPSPVGIPPMGRSELTGSPISPPRPSGAPPLSGEMPVAPGVPSMPPLPPKAPAKKKGLFGL